MGPGVPKFTFPAGLPGITRALRGARLDLLPGFLGGFDRTVEIQDLSNGGILLKSRTNCSVVGAASAEPAPANPSTAAIPVATAARIVVRVFMSNAPQELSCGKTAELQ